MIQLPRVGWRLLACKSGASPDCNIVVVVLDTGKNEQCVWPQSATTMHELVAGHQGVKTPGDPATLPSRALDDSQLSHGGPKKLFSGNALTANK